MFVEEGLLSIDHAQITITSNDACCAHGRQLCTRLHSCLGEGCHAYNEGSAMPEEKTSPSIMVARQHGAANIANWVSEYNMQKTTVPMSNPANLFNFKATLWEATSHQSSMRPWQAATQLEPRQYQSLQQSLMQMVKSYISSMHRIMHGPDSCLPLCMLEILGDCRLFITEMSKGCAPNVLYIACAFGGFAIC